MLLQAKTEDNCFDVLCEVFDTLTLQAKTSIQFECIAATYNSVYEGNSMLYNKRLAVVYTTDIRTGYKGYFPAVVGEDTHTNRTELLDYQPAIRYPDACLAFANLASTRRDYPIDTTKVYTF